MQDKVSEKCHVKLVCVYLDAPNVTFILISISAHNQDRLIGQVSLLFNFGSFKLPSPIMMMMVMQIARVNLTHPSFAKFYAC